VGEGNRTVDGHNDGDDEDDLLSKISTCHRGQSVKQDVSPDLEEPRGEESFYVPISVFIHT
jgi:hypothetical protein